MSGPGAMWRLMDGDTCTHYVYLGDDPDRLPQPSLARIRRLAAEPLRAPSIWYGGNSG